MGRTNGTASKGVRGGRTAVKSAAAGGRAAAAKTKRSAARSKKSVWKLRLYIAGQTPKSMAAIRNLKRLCEESLKAGYRIEVIDLTKSLSAPRTTR